MRKYGKLKKRGSVRKGKNRYAKGTDNRARLNRNYKDYLFRLVFGDENRKDNILSLYNAVSDRSYTDPECITITTLQDALYVGVRNDVSFLYEYMDESYENLWEHESTYCPNMPLRGLIYFASLYKAYVDNVDISIHGNVLVKIPTPKYIVFYNGKTERPAVETMRLSDAFKTECKKGDYEWSATVYNLNSHENTQLLKSCRPLFEYSEVVKRVETVMKQKLEKDDSYRALNNVIQDCINEGLLADILRKNRAEVLDMCIQEIEQKKYENSIREEAKASGYDSGYSSGYDSGYAKGEEQGRIKLTIDLVREGDLSIDKGAKRLGKTPKELEEMMKK